MGRMTRYAFFFVIMCGLWVWFKIAEPQFFPVVTDFTITEAVAYGENVAIEGHFNKVRDCTFVDVVGYSGEKYVAVIFYEHPDAPVVSRITGVQTYGPWLIVPKVPQLTLYAHHICATGMVTTKLFDGALVL